MEVDDLIYGTFPDLPGSQQVVHKTAGITPELESRLIRFYNDFGDCKNEEFRTSLTVRRFELESAEPVVTVTRVSHQGKDFSGRWGALLRHTAVLGPQQYEQLFFDPGLLAPLLVSSGTSEELSAAGRLELQESESAACLLEPLLDLSISDYRDNLAALLAGKRLVLYSETNTETTDSYLRQLVNLLPLSLKENLSWSEFSFRPDDKLDVALAHSSRHEPPGVSKLPFAQSGSNSLSEAELPPGYIEDYLELLEQAIASGDLERLADLICDSLR